MKASTKTLCSIIQALFMGYDGIRHCSPVRGTCVSEDTFPAPCPAVIDLDRQATLVFFPISQIQSQGRVKALLLSNASTMLYRDLISLAWMDAYMFGWPLLNFMEYSCENKETFFVSFLVEYDLKYFTVSFKKCK